MVRDKVLSGSHRLCYTFNSWLVTRNTRLVFALPLARSLPSPYILRKNTIFLLLESSNSISFSEIDVRAIGYITIDINRRLLTRQDYINVLNTLTQLHEQLPVPLMNEVNEGLNRTLRMTCDDPSSVSWWSSIRWCFIYRHGLIRRVQWQWETWTSKSNVHFRLKRRSTVRILCWRCSRFVHRTCQSLHWFSGLLYRHLRMTVSETWTRSFHHVCTNILLTRISFSRVL